MINFKEFLLLHSTLSKEFLEDFYVIIDEKFIIKQNEFLIDSIVLYKWLEITRKYEFYNTIKLSYKLNQDYIIEKVNNEKKTSSKSNNKVTKYILTPKCVKKICQSTKSKKGDEIRNYFIEIEFVLFQYQEYIIQGLKDKQKQLERNMKPKINTNKKIIYVFQALNTDLTLYKIGKTINSKKRQQSHNSPLANDLEMIFEYETDSINEVEKCVKLLMKPAQYRKYKEIFEVDIDIIKSVIRDCDCSIKTITEKIKNKSMNSIKTGGKNDKLYMYIPNTKYS